MLSNREKEVFNGYSIISADIIQKGRITLGLKEDYDLFVAEEKHREHHGNLDDFVSKGEDELAKKVIVYNSQSFSDKDHWAGAKWSGGVRRLYPVFLSAKEKIVICFVQGDALGAIEESPNDDNWYDEDPLISEIPFMHNTMFAASNISGKVFFAGAPRKLFMRTGASKWTDLTDEKNHPNLQTDLKKEEIKHGSISNIPYGFHAFDGFSDVNIYAGGRGGDCWHYNGKKWKQLDLPANFNITTIACTLDGVVYIAGQHGGLIKGNISNTNESWEVIEHDTPITFNEMTWFQNTLYLATDEALYTYTEDKLEKYHFPEKGAAQYSFSGVKSCDEALLSYGPSHALVFDGKEWTHLIGSPSVEIPDVKL